MNACLILAVALSQAPQAPQAQSPGWSEAHPAAFSSLAAWTEAHPEQARRVFWWDRQHVNRAETFLRWIVEQPGESLEAFEAKHPDWPAVGEVLRQDAPAMEAFVAWGRAHPAALRELSAERGAFARLGFRQLAELWQHHPPARPPESP